MDTTDYESKLALGEWSCDLVAEGINLTSSGPSVNHLNPYTQKC